MIRYRSGPPAFKQWVRVRTDPSCCGAPAVAGGEQDGDHLLPGQVPAGGPGDDQPNGSGRGARRQIQSMPAPMRS